MYLSSYAGPQKSSSNTTPDGFVLIFRGQVHVSSLSVIKYHTYINDSFYVTVIILLPVTMVLALSA